MSTIRGFPQASDPIMRPGHVVSAKTIEATGRLARNITGRGSTRVSYRNGSIVIGQAEETSKNGFEFLTKTTIRIYARWIAYHSTGVLIPIPQTDVLLAGATCFVHARVVRRTASATLQVAGAFPGSDNTNTNLVLYGFTLTGTRYKLTHCGWWNFNFINPLA